MENYNEIEKEMNKSATYGCFHDMGLTSLLIEDSKIILRFTLYKYVDIFNLLTDDNQLAILEVTYEDTIINNFIAKNFQENRDSEVMSFDENDGIISLCFIPTGTEDDFYTSEIEFSFKKYKWKVVEIMSIEEYSNMIGEAYDNVEVLVKKRKEMMRLLDEIK